jgi:ferredoxin
VASEPMARRLTLLVDPVSCDGRGVCAELLPEWITLDPWGFPVVRSGPVPTNLLDHARRAVSSCPRLALHLVPETG